MTVLRYEYSLERPECTISSMVVYISGPQSPLKQRIQAVFGNSWIGEHFARSHPIVVTNENINRINSLVYPVRPVLAPGAGTDHIVPTYLVDTPAIQDCRTVD